MSRIPLTDDTELDDPWSEENDFDDSDYRPLDFDYIPPREDLSVVDSFDSDIDSALDNLLEDDPESEEEEQSGETSSLTSEHLTEEEANALISEILYVVDRFSDKNNT